MDEGFVELDSGYQMVCTLRGVLSIGEVFDWLAEQPGYVFPNGHVITEIEDFQIVEVDGVFWCAATCRVHEQDGYREPELD